MKLATGKMTVINGESHRDFIHVADICNCLMTLIENNVSGVYNIATGRSLTIRSVAESIRKILNMKLTLEYDNKKIDNSFVDITKISEYWLPEINVDAGIKTLV